MPRHTIVNPATGMPVLKTGTLGRELQKTYSKAALDRAKQERAKKKKQTQTKTKPAKQPAKQSAMPLGLASEWHKKYKLKIGTKIVLGNGVTKVLKRDVNGRIFWGAP